MYPGWGGAAAHNRKQLMGLKTSILVPRSFSLPAPPARTLWYEKITSRALFGISLKKTVSCNSLFRFNFFFFFFLRGKEEGSTRTGGISQLTKSVTISSQKKITVLWNVVKKEEGGPQGNIKFGCSYQPLSQVNTHAFNYHCLMQYYRFEICFANDIANE